MSSIQAMRPYDVMDIVESYSAGQIFKQRIQSIFSPSGSELHNYYQYATRSKSVLAKFFKKSFAGHNNLVATVKQMKKQVYIIKIGDF